MFAEDMTEWNFGPEYVFQLNKTVMLYIDAIVTTNIIAIVQCHPKGSVRNVTNILYCRAHKITFTTMLRDILPHLKINEMETIEVFTSSEISVPDQLFEIEFGKNGIQSFKVVRDTKGEMLYNDTIVSIIEQFNIGIDLSIASEEIDDNMKKHENVSESHVISSFWHEEDTLRAKCNTSWIITYTPTLQKRHKLKKFLVRHNRKHHFHLKLLPIPYEDPAEKIFSIYRTRKTCSRQQQHIIFQKEKWNIYNVVITLILF